MLDHMVECSGLCWSNEEQCESTKGSWYYQVLQMGKGKRDASPVIVTVWHKKSGMKDIVYLPLREKLELIGEWTQHFYDFEWPLSF